VSPEKQNMHIGEMLLNRCIEISSENEMKTMKLEVQNDNYHAIRFYENYRFKFCGDASGNSRYMNREI
jgi:ribosomal protein S18 acetylase RimI-like enzyme